MKSSKRAYIEKRGNLDNCARQVASELKNILGISGIERVRVLQRYEVYDISDCYWNEVVRGVFSEAPQDEVHAELPAANWTLAVELLPGQYDQQADSAEQCIRLLTGSEHVVHCSKVYLFYGAVSDEQRGAIRNYLINPIEAREALDVDACLEEDDSVVDEVALVAGFGSADDAQLECMRSLYSLVMSSADAKLCRQYFGDVEQRDPTITELRVLDTYWSDHCRHTTFNTILEEVLMSECAGNRLTAAWQRYQDVRSQVYGNQTATRPMTLMDAACIGAKQLKQRGLLNDLDESDEINACSVKVRAECADGSRDALLLFKNETHNHPTEIEPYGGASTCLGGAIRDPLSGRGYVFGALRVSGSADPREPIARTLEGKLPQRVITTKAADGYSAYGNQIGVATGKVQEYYHPGYQAKRLECGAVIGAVLLDNVRREQPRAGDVVLLVGGDTGRDGIGGATGSSKEHDEGSQRQCGAEVQKGNAPVERKLQRLFRNPALSKLIKKCNDFGAGGVAVAIGELAPGLEIYLDNIPKKYAGLDGTELALSESQERMAVVVEADAVTEFCEIAAAENLLATVVAKVTHNKRLVMYWRGAKIVDIKREFLDSSGAQQRAVVALDYRDDRNEILDRPFAGHALLGSLADLNGCLQKGLAERFDSSIGSGTVLMPFGGARQLTPAEGLAMKLPLGDNCRTAALFAHGWALPFANNPYQAAIHSVVEAVSKIVAMGGDYRTVRLSLQEYFEKLGKDCHKWGKPLAALLGALEAQLELGIPAIGGKDSMSGTFKELNVPPTLIAFAATIVVAARVVSNELKQCGSYLYLLKVRRTPEGLPIWAALRSNFATAHGLAAAGKVLSMHSVKGCGVLHAVSEMALGNTIGVRFVTAAATLAAGCMYGDILLESITAIEDISDLYLIGKTAGNTLELASESIPLSEICERALQPLQEIFPLNTQSACGESSGNAQNQSNHRNAPRQRLGASVAKPRVIIPVFPGTNCEYDSARAFVNAGARVREQVFCNLTTAATKQSVAALAHNISHSEILFIPGGFSAADEPDGSGKYIAAVLRCAAVEQAIYGLLERGGLILGICNGFQALIKSGLLPYGRLAAQQREDATLTFNEIGRHVSAIVRTKVQSKLSPWLQLADMDSIYSVPISHGEGRFICRPELYEQLSAAGQIATCYVQPDGSRALHGLHNPNGSYAAVEGVSSPDGRIFGKMGHSERIGDDLYKNVPGEYDAQIFQSGVKWFK